MPITLHDGPSEMPPGTKTLAMFRTSLNINNSLPMCLYQHLTNNGSDALLPECSLQEGLSQCLL